MGKRVWGGNQSTGPRTYYTVRWKAGDVTEEYEESGNLDGCGEMIAEYNAGLAMNEHVLLVLNLADAERAVKELMVSQKVGREEEKWVEGYVRELETVGDKWVRRD